VRGGLYFGAQSLQIVGGRVGRVRLIVLAKDLTGKMERCIKFNVNIGRGGVEKTAKATKNANLSGNGDQLIDIYSILRHYDYST
jgi:hypothetical protein